MEAAVVVFGDYISPFSYLAEAVLARSRADGVRIERCAYELWPAPVPLPELAVQEPRGAFEATVLPIAEQLGVEIRYPAIATRTRKAHEAFAYARDAGRAEPMQDAIFRAYFIEGRDIGRIDELVAVGESVGLERTALKVALDIDQYSERVDADRARAAALGITAVPAFVRGGPYDRDVRLGLLEYDMLTAWLRGETE
jgi:predicted DsbA family dithiol-disulfide isomerase